MLAVFFAIERLGETGWLDASKGGLTWLVIVGLFGIGMVAFASLTTEIRDVLGLGEHGLLNVVLSVAVVYLAAKVDRLQRSLASLERQMERLRRGPDG
jgi:hypothetical protein